MPTQIQVDYVLAKRFRQNVRRLLDERGMTQMELAERLGTARNHITQTLESESDRIGSDTFEKWAAALGVNDPLDLLKKM